MRKIKLLITLSSFLLITLFILSIVSAQSFTSQDKSLINQCKKQCSIDKKLELKSCTSEQLSCRSECSNNICKKECNKEKKSCFKEVKGEYRECLSDCKFKPFTENVTCNFNNETYNAGETFRDQCNECRCGYNGEIKCDELKNCGFTNFTISQDYCESSGGFFQRLCWGPYFGIKCAAEAYCQCGGINNFSCPEDYTCVEKFSVRGIHSQISEWKTYLGEPVGNVGICAFN